MAATVNITVFAGETCVIRLSCCRSDQVTPIPLTGATVVFGAKLLPTDPAPEILKTATQGGTGGSVDIVFVDVTNGIVQITLESADSEDNPGVYYYSVVVIEASGTDSVQVVGQLIFQDHGARVTV